MLFNISEHNAWLPSGVIAADSKEEAIETLQKQVAVQSRDKVIWLTTSIRKYLDLLDASPVASIELVHTLVEVEKVVGDLGRRHHIVLKQDNGA